MKPIIALLIPTNKPHEFKTKFLTALAAFEPLKDYVAFCFNFQPPWDDDSIQKMVNFLKIEGFTVYHCFNDYQWTPQTFSFVTMRNDAARLAPKDIQFFADYDDDIVVENPEYCAKIWATALSYLLKYSNYGSLRIDSCYEGKLGGALKRDTLYTMFSFNNRTGLGLIYRNIYNGNVLPNEQLKLLGCQEDHLEIMQRVKDGYLHAFIRAPFGYHTDFKTVKSRVTYGLEPLMDRPNAVSTYLKKIYFEITYEPYGKTIESWLDYGEKLDMSLSLEEILLQLKEAYESAIREH